MKLKEIRDEDDIRKINYYVLGKVVSKKRPYPENNPELVELEVTRRSRGCKTFRFRFYDIKLVKYFVTKLSQANFKRERMRLKFGLGKFILILMAFTAFTSASSEELTGDYAADCINESVINENEKLPEYNFLSFPAISTDDPYISAVSYFNSKLSVIVNENYVTQYEYSPVPYYIYKSFINSPSLKDYYERCIMNVYETKKIY